MKIFRSHSNNLDFKKIKNLFLLLLSLLAINGLRADTFIVSNTDDSGAGSLRQAILDANANPGADVITFDIDGGGAQSITVSSALPTISGALTVDGTTQPGYSGSPLIAVGADFSSTIFYAENAGSVALTALDVSKNGTAAGIAFQMQNLSSLSVTNCWAKNRTYGLYINQCSGITATGNDLTDCGVSGGWAIFLGSSNGTNMDISNNAIAGATTNGLWLYYCSNVSVAPSNAAVEVGNLLKPLTSPLIVEGGSNNSVSGLDLEKTGAVGGSINFTSVNGLTVTNNIFKNRIHGLYINQCSGITATGNDLTDCGVSGGWAIFLGSSNGTNMDVSNNTIAGATTNGLWLYYCSNVSVAPSNAAVEVGNLLKPLTTPLNVEGGSNNSVSGLDLEKTGAVGGGINFTSVNGLTVTNNIFKNRIHGLYINQCSGITATGNDLTDCGVSGGWAIFLGSSNGTNMDVSNNTIAGATTNGLWLYYCSNVSVAPSNAAVEVGNLLKPLTSPLNVEGGSNNSVSGLDLEKTGAVGGSINFTSVNGLTVTNNIFKNRIHGLYINQCSGITATGNDLTDCGVAGGWAIFLGSSNGTNMDVSNNTIAGATTNGLWLYYCSNVSVAPSNAAVEVGNLLKPLTTPLIVEGGSNNSVSGLDLEKTGAVGGSINFTSVNGLTVTGCTLKNRSTGLFFNSCATVSATCNLLENCTNGIQSYYCAAPVFTNNTFYNNTLGITQNGGAAVNAQSNFWAFNTPLENQPNGYSGSVDVSNPLASAAGCAPVLVVPSEISILGNNLEILNGDVSPATNDGTDFGSIYTTGQTATHTFSISNTGIGQLVLDGAALSGTGASHFSLENLTYPTSVAPNGSLEIDVTFDPSATGLQVATLTFENNDSDEDPYSFDIQGIGLACSPTLPSGTVFRWTNGGGDGLWSNANNWLNSSNLPTVPTAGSVAFFSCLGSADATLDVNTSIGSLVFDANYGNTLHLGGQILTLTSALVVPNASQLDAGTGLVKMSNTTINCAANLNNAEFVSGDFYLLQNLNVLNDLTITSINALQGTVANLKILVGGDVVSDDTNGFGNCCGYQPVFVSLTSGSDQNLSGTGVFTFLDISKTGGNVLMLNDITVHFGTLTGTSTAHFVGSGGILKFNHSSINFAGDVDNVQFVANDFYLYQNLKVLNDLTITSINALQGTAANLKILVGGDVISNDATGFANCCGYQPVFVSLTSGSDQNLSGTGVFTFLDISKTGGNVLMLNDITVSFGTLTGTATGHFVGSGGILKFNHSSINFAGDVDNVQFVANDFYLYQNLNVLNDLTITSINALQGTAANLKILVGGDVVSDDTNGFANCCGYQPVFVSLISGSDQNLSGTGVFTFLDISKTGGNVLMLNDITVHFGTLTGTSTAHFVGSGGILKFNHSSINFAGDVDNVQFVANDFYLYQNLNVLNDLTITSINALQGTAANLKILVGGDVISNDANGFANCCGYQPVFLALNGSTDQNISGTGVLTFVEFAKTGGNALFGSFNKTFNTAKVTAGTWNLLGNTFSSAGGFSASTGGAIAGSGTLTGNVNIGSASFLSPDCINITGTLVMASGSHFVANISGSTVCTGFDQVNVSGSATLTGSILDLSASVAGSGFKILDAASLSGTFTTTNFPVGCGWSILYNNPATGEVSVSSGADATPPTAVCQNITKNLDATSSATVVAGEINNGSTDNCTSAILAIVNGQTTFSCADIGQNHVLTLRATDAAGNSATCLATVTIAAYPNALPFDISVFGNSLEISSGDATPATADGTDFGAVAIGGSLVRTFSIQNTGSAALPINSILSSNPSKFAVSGVPGSVAPGGSANFTVTFSPTATGIENATITVNSLDCDEMNYNFSVAGEAACSNPVFTICPENQSANTASNSCDAVVSYSATASDPITGYSFSGATTGSGSGTGSGATFNKGVTSVVLTATNDCGTTTCAFTVTVSDIQPPVVTCPAPVTINMTEGQCSGTTTLTSPTVTDNCPVNTVLGNALDFDGANDIVNLPTTSMPSGNVDHTVECWTYFKSGQTEPKVILWYGTSLGNQQAVYIVDPTNGNKISVNHGSAGNAGVFNTAMPLNTWTHLAFVYHGSTNSIDLYLNGAFQQTLTYNAALNLPTTTFQFGALYSTNFRAGMKLDEVRIWNLARSAAQIQASKDVELGGSETGLVRYFKFNQGTAGGDNNGLTALAATTGVGGTLVNFALSGSVSNWVSGAPGTIAATNNAPATFPKGQTVVTWTATDASNNTATCSQTVTVVDNLAPSITCAAPVSINTTTGLCTGTTVLTNPTVVDNCTIPSTGNSLKFDGTNDVVVLDDNLKNALNGGTAITVEYWFKGTNIQSAFRFQDISNAFVVAGWAGSSTPKHIISVDGGTAGVSIGNSVLDGNWHHIAMTWQKNTVNGFKSYVDGVIVDQRNSANANLPVVSQRPTLGGYFVAGASQEYMNGSLEEVRIWNTARTQAQIQAVMRSELVGNEANLLAYYNFNQGTAGGNNAGVTALPDLATGLAGTNTGNLTNFALNGQTSNWLNQPINLANNAPAVFPKGNTTVTWTGKDASGNSATCSQTVTVTDNQAPVLTCGANLTVSPTAGGNCEVKLVLNSPLISDNCTPFLENNLSFDASNDRVTIPSTADFNFGTANFTIEMWVKTSGTAFQVFADKRINSSAGTWWRTGLSGGKYWFEISAAQNCQTTKLFNDGYWHHVAFVRNGTSPAIFVDGVSVPVTIAGAWDANVSNTADVGAGLFLGNACCGLKGQMDELRIWKSARTQFEILANKNITLTGSEANLLAYYNFNQGTPGGSNPTVTTLTDLATAIGGANNGTLTNFALTGNISNWVGGGPISLATSNAPAAFPVGNSTVTWSITDSDGNTGTCNQTVTAVPSNLATSHSVTNVTCFGGANGTVFTTNTGGLAPFSYLWNIAKTTANINLLVAATYNLTTTDAAGCSKTSSAAVGEAPAINFAVGLTSNGTNPPTFNAVFTTTGGTPGYLYNRTGMAATLYLPATDPIFQNLAANATFIFKVKDANGCNKSVVKKTPATTPPPPSGNVAERFLENEKANDASGEAIGMAVFPNPTSDFLNVEFLSEGKTNGQISVFDMLGKVVFSKNVDFEEEAIFQVPVQNLSAGGYVLIFRDDFGKIISNRFIVERN